MTSAKFGAIVTGALVVMYVALLGQRGFELLATPNTVAKAMGAVILALPVFALWAIIRELIFGLQIERLAKLIQNEGTWPHFEFDFRPSGRPTRESADRVFETVRDTAAKLPDDWHSWFNLGLAYDACGDRRRARAAMRKALKLNRA